MDGAEITARRSGGGYRRNFSIIRLLRSSAAAGRPHHFIFQTDGAGDISEGHVPCTLRLLGTAPRIMTSRTHEVPTCDPLRSPSRYYAILYPSRE